MSLTSIFRPDHVRYDGVRPFNIWLLRTLYVLMAVFVAPYAWGVLLRHEGPWHPVQAVAFCIWATYPVLALLGLLNPLRMLPLILFAAGYKALWLTFVAYPLWQAGALIGSPAEQMARDFMWTPLAIVAVPWGYVFRRLVLPQRRLTTT
jgi:hypothetical protein